jgi:hypothetical protein
MGASSFGGKIEGTRSLGRLKHGLEDNIKIDIEEVERGGADWIDIAQDRDRWRAVVNEVMNFDCHKIGGISLVVEEL